SCSNSGATVNATFVLPEALPRPTSRALAATIKHAERSTASGASAQETIDDAVDPESHVLAQTVGYSNEQPVADAKRRGISTTKRRELLDRHQPAALPAVNLRAQRGGGRGAR